MRPLPLTSDSTSLLAFAIGSPLAFLLRAVAWTEFCFRSEAALLLLDIFAERPLVFGTEMTAQCSLTRTTLTYRVVACGPA